MYTEIVPASLLTHENSFIRNLAKILTSYSGLDLVVEQWGSYFRLYRTSQKWGKRIRKIEIYRLSKNRWHADYVRTRSASKKIHKYRTYTPSDIGKLIDHYFIEGSEKPTSRVLKKKASY